MVDVAVGNNGMEKLRKLSKRKEKLIEKKKELEQRMNDKKLSSQERQRISDRIKKTEIDLKNIGKQIEKRLH